MKNDIKEKVNINRIKDSIESILKVKFANNNYKQTVHVKSDRLNFACPYCGDSQKTNKKKRGNLYFNSLLYRCYNGDCSKERSSLINLLKDFDKFNNFSLEDINGFDDIKSEYVEQYYETYNQNIDLFFDKDTLKQHCIHRDTLKKKLQLEEIEGSNIEKYLKDRLQYKNYKFLWNDKMKLLFILNTIDEEFVFGMQIRTFKKSAQKYLTYKLSKIYELCKIDVYDEINKIDVLSHAFGLFEVDINNPITLFEGPLDSFLFPNSIGLCSSQNKLPFKISNVRWLYDFDTTGKNKSLEKIQNDEQVFLWQKFIDDNNIKINKNKIDWNDIMIYIKKNKIKLKNVQNYFSNDILDMIYI